MAAAPAACSGEMYEAVPSTEPAAVSWPPQPQRAMPKSVSTRVPFGPDQQVARLDVAVHDALLVGGVQRVGGLGDQRHRAGRGEPADPLSVRASASPSTYSMTRNAMSCSLP